MVEGVPWEGWYTQYRHTRLRGRRISVVLLKHLPAEQKGWACRHGKDLLSAAPPFLARLWTLCPESSRGCSLSGRKNRKKQKWAFHRARGLGAVCSEDRQNQIKLKGVTEPGLDCGLESLTPVEEPTHVPIYPWLQLGSPSPKHLSAAAVTFRPRIAAYM